MIGLTWFLHILIFWFGSIIAIPRLQLGLGKKRKVGIWVSKRKEGREGKGREDGRGEEERGRERGEGEKRERRREKRKERRDKNTQLLKQQMKFNKDS